MKIWSTYSYKDADKIGPPIHAKKQLNIEEINHNAKRVENLNDLYINAYTLTQS